MFRAPELAPTGSIPNLNPSSRESARRALSIVLLAGFLLAPLIGLLYSPQLGLMILVVSIAITLSLVAANSETIGTARQLRLRWLLAANAILLVIALGILVISLLD
jgi:cytochrome b561